MVWKNTLDFFTAPAEYGAEEVALDAVLKPGFGSGLGSQCMLLLRVGGC